MTEPYTSLERVFLLPGEYHITKKSKQLATLLGSCVAVCLYNDKNKNAAMNHFIRDKASANDKLIGRFGDLSIRHILKVLMSVDSNCKNYKAKIYGGGAVVGHLGLGVGIGKQNIAMAEMILAENKIPIVERDVGGTQGRKIYFDTSNFNVESRLIGEERKDFSKRNIRVLIVDDSAIVRKILRKIIETTEGIEVVGEAGDAFEARDLMISTDPDVISLDIIMPKLDGLKFLEKIMVHYPKPVIIVSTIAKSKSDIARKAEKLGAVGVVDKDSLEIYKGLERAYREYIPMIRTAANRIVEKKVFL
ncbi:MAG: response regulator [Candidatus Omnitrophica bacterium]|nr:response regulator [Candidatus Omnitrophota bacterium]